MREGSLLVTRKKYQRRAHCGLQSKNRGGQTKEFLFRKKKLCGEIRWLRFTEIKQVKTSKGDWKDISWSDDFIANFVLDELTKRGIKIEEKR